MPYSLMQENSILAGGIIMPREVNTALHLYANCCTLKGVYRHIHIVVLCTPVKQKERFLPHAAR